MSSHFIRTPADFARLVKFGFTTESTTLEFKQDYTGRAIPKGQPERERLRREGRKETARDIAQFANTSGGSLLIGVAEAVTSPGGQRVAHAIAPIADMDDLCEWVEEAASEFMVPSTLSRELCPIQLNEGLVLAVNIPARHQLATVWDRHSHTAEHLRRTSRGKAWMNPDEMEVHIMNGSRAGFLMFSDLLSRATTKEVVVTDGYWGRPNPGDVRATRFTPNGLVMIGPADEESFAINVPIGTTTRSLRLPYGVIEHAWIDAGMINLLMSVRLMMNQGILTIEPRP